MHNMLCHNRKPAIIKQKKILKKNKKITSMEDGKMNKNLLEFERTLSPTKTELGTTLSQLVYMIC